MHPPNPHDFKVTPPQPPLPGNDKRARFEKKKFFSNSDLIKQRYSSNTSNRNWLTVWAACVVTLWLWFVLCIITGTRLSDGVKITLLGTTTLNVLGLMYIVLKGYFKEDEKLEDDEK